MPPDAWTVNEPVLSPKHKTSWCNEVSSLRNKFWIGCEIVTTIESRQLFASKTETEYIPADKPVKIWEETNGPLSNW